MEGKCNCETVTVKVDDNELFSKPRGHMCHCFNCRKTSGSAVATNMKIELSKVTITGADNLQIYEDPRSLSGNVVKRFFCKTCGTSIKSETDAATKAGMVILKLGIFPRVPQPEFEGFAQEAQSWIKPHATSGRFKTIVGGEKMEE